MLCYFTTVVFLVVTAAHNLHTKLLKHQSTFISYLEYTYIRVSNHPDFVGIIPILLENPESRRNFGRDREIPILKAQKVIFVKS